MISNAIEREPFFMSNEDWYRIEIDQEDGSVHITLTDKAPQEAIEDYNKEMNKTYDPRVEIIWDDTFQEGAE